MNIKKYKKAIEIYIKKYLKSGFFKRFVVQGENAEDDCVDLEIAIK